jgi:probable phosphoglycerate mutase
MVAGESLLEYARNRAEMCHHQHNLTVCFTVEGMSTASHHPQICLVRHGETEWSRDGRHTGRTDIALTGEGRRRAKLLGGHLAGRTFGLVLTSPLARAKDTCDLAGFGAVAQLDDNLLEWDYGVYEGRTTLDIREKDDPDWSVWLSPIKGGESLGDVYARALRVVTRVRGTSGDVAIFAHGHILRILAAAWIGLPAITGRSLALDTATVSLLGYERKTPVIREWNVTPAE